MLTKLDNIPAKAVLRSPYNASVTPTGWLFISNTLFYGIWDTFLALLRASALPANDLLVLELEDKINKLCILGFKLAVEKEN